jgi:hypothetical protein
MQAQIDKIKSTYETYINDAKYRANKLLVVLIFNKFDCTKTLQAISNSVYDSETIIYNVDSVVVPNSYNKNVCKVWEII